jgi:hypothetical protein
MASKLDFLIIGFSALAIYSISLTNDKMAFMDLQNSSTFESYMSNRKSLLQKFHPDSSRTEASVDLYEKFQETDKLFNTQYKFKTRIIDLFVFGDIDENSLSKYKSAFRKMTQVIIGISLLCVVIFVKLDNFKLQITSFVILLVFLSPIFYIFYGQYLFVFEGDASFFVLLRSFVSNFAFKDTFRQATVNEIIDILLAIAVVAVNLIVLIRTPRAEAPRDYNKLFSALVNDVKTAGTGNNQTKIECLRATIEKIDDSMPKESIVWKRVQKLFSIVSIGFLLYSLVMNK